MRLYLINLDRRPDRLAAMTAGAGALGLALTRIAAVDATSADPAELDRWFAPSGPLGEIPRGDKACFLSHRRAWEAFLATGDAHAVVLEDDVRLSPAAPALLASDAWVPADAGLVKLEHYGPRGQRVLLTDFRNLSLPPPRQAATAVGEDFQLARMLSRHTGAAAYLLSRAAAQLLLDQTHFDLPVDHLMFNPNNSKLFARLRPFQLLPAIARQQQFSGARQGAKSDIEGTRKPLRALSLTYARRELVRFGYGLRLVPQQLAALAGGAKFTAVRTTD
jgi:glycosyl transferase family 25